MTDYVEIRPELIGIFDQKR